MNEQLIINETLVQCLIAAQFPQWKDLPVRPVAHSGWDNRTFHLGEHMLVRMPNAEDYALQVEKEQRWLPKLAPLLPLPIPVPLGLGEPAKGYSWTWSIYAWLPGEAAAPSSITDLSDFAINLAQFLIALQSIDSTIGQLTVGDPACDLAIAWTLFKGKSRDAFRSTLLLDNDTWMRGQGWALWKALIIAAGLTNSNAVEARQCWHIIDEILTEHRCKTSLP